METPIWVPLGAALLGAIAAGVFQTISTLVIRHKKSEAVLTAIASEVDAICRLIRHQRYLEGIDSIASDIEQGVWQGETYVIDIRSNYFTVFEGLVDELGYLKPKQCAKIANFYAYCKSAIDSTRPDGPHSNDPNSQEAALNMISVGAILQSILNLGDEITKMPKLSVAEMLKQLPDNSQ